MLDLTYEAPKPRVIAGVKHDWELVIGMEIHAQVSSNAKLFSGASTQVGAEPNSNVAFVDAAMPGMLPVINEFCVEQAVRTGLGLKAAINLRSAFDRKNYFYPDLPQGYQISQLYHPIVGEGEVLVEMSPGVARLVRVERIHLEQDAGKSIHDMDPTMSFVDFNRTGVALMEIVSRPDIRGPEEAAAYVVKLRQILRYLGTCDGDMQHGNLRADVNVSVCRPGQYEKYQATQDFSHLGTRCEIKNMNSMRFIQLAIDYEARRQIAILEDGGSVVQETRLYDPDKNETRSMRSKEEAHDYRYFPCPDLLPLEIEQAWVDDIAAKMPELPDAKKARFMGDFGLTDYDASELTKELWVASFYEDSLSELTRIAQEAGKPEAIDPKKLANWIINNAFGQMGKAGLDRDLLRAYLAGDLHDPTVKNVRNETFYLSALLPTANAAVTFATVTSEVSSQKAKEAFDIAFSSGRDFNEIFETEQMKQVTDTGAIEAALDALIAANPDQVEKAKVNAKLAGWFTGQVLKSTGGKANPAIVNALVAQKLGL